MYSRLWKPILSSVCATLTLWTTSLGATEEKAQNLTVEQRSASLHLQELQPLWQPGSDWANLQDDPFGDPKQDPEMYGFKPKSTRRAFLYSLLLPGAGQIYNGSTIIKPILFLGIEAAGIYSYITFHGKGVDKRGEYEIFADAYWSYDRYIQSLEAQHPTGEWRYGDKAKWFDPSTNDSVNTFSEHLDVWIDQVADSSRPIRNRNYYENVGKYDQFMYGWDDQASYPDKVPFSPHRGTYLGKRKAANDEFGKASTALVLTIVNHLASAFDAALSARRYNNKQDRLSNVGVKMRYVLYEGRAMPKLTLTYHY